ASFRNILIDHRMGFTLPHDDPNRQHGAGIAPLAGTAFSEGSIQSFLTRLGLPNTSPLSVLAVEVLPGPLSVRVERPGLARSQGATAEDDPIGSNLGRRRILRVSPLPAVPATC